MHFTNHRLALVILMVYFLLASVYSVINPLFESPDEVWHYEYVRWLAEGNGLAAPEDVGHAPWHQEGSQPPLYYLTAAALTAWIPTDNANQIIRYNPHAAVGQADSFGNKNVMIHGEAERWPWRGVALAAHMTRFFSIVLGAITIWMTYLSARLFWQSAETSPESNSWPPVIAAAIIAFNPQFIFLTAAVNNDNLVTCVSAAGIAYGLWLVQVALGTNRGESQPNKKTLTDLQVTIFGLLAGLAALSKLSGLLLSVFVALTLVLIAWQQRSWRYLVRWGLISGACMIAVSGWWYLRNWLLFGDPLALSAMFDILPRRAEPPTMDELLARAEGIWNSIWAVFGWFNVVVDPWIYWFYSALASVGFLGFIVFVIQQVLRGRLPQEQENSPLTAKSPSSVSAKSNITAKVLGLQTFLLVVWVGMLVASLWRWAQMRYPQGRLLFPALSATALLIAVGLDQWLPRRLSQTIRVWLYAGLTGILILIATAAPWLYIQPSYQPMIDQLAADSVSSGGPLLLEEEPDNKDVPNTTSNGQEASIGAPELSLPTTAFAELIQLESAQISHNQRVPGQNLNLVLNWRALQPIAQDLSVFIHLIDENEILQAQSDSFPGQGNLPTSEWEAGALIADLHQIDIPITVPSPARLKVNVGLYNFESGERLLIGGSDHWTLGFIRLSPAPGDGTLPNSVFVNFEDKIALVGYEFDRYTLAPGDTLILKLWWEALDAPLRDIKVFTHLVLPPDATWAQDDDRPRAGTAKTDSWQLGDRIEDQYEMTLPQEAPAGVYFVEIGLYDGETYDRLKVNFSDKGTVIGQVRVLE